MNRNEPIFISKGVILRTTVFKTESTNPIGSIINIIDMRLIILTLALIMSLSLNAQEVEILGTGQIKNVLDPVDAQDAATKAYVDQMAEIMLNAGLNGVVADIDSNVYKTIKIGDQVWMAENLRTSRYADGTSILNINDFTDWSTTNTDSTGAWSWYDTLSTNEILYGKLYNWHVVDTLSNGGRNVCPSGWHVPTDAEWMELTDFLEENGYGYEGSGADIGKSMAATFRWTFSAMAGDIGNDLGSNNSSGFSGLPGGFRSSGGAFSSVGSNGYWWSSSENSTAYAWYRNLFYDDDDVSKNYNVKGSGFSVRCLRD